jgi:hypothetical protein
MAVYSTSRRRGRASARAAGNVPGLRLVTEARPLAALAAPLWLAQPESAQGRADYVRKRVADMIECVSAGRVYEAIEEFYAPNVHVSPGAMAPMFCLDPQLERGYGERREIVWERFSADGVGINFDTSFIECELEFSAANSRRFTSRYVAIAQWCDGKIARESLQFVR